MTKKHLLKESFIATIIIVLSTYIISFIPWSNEYGKALHQGFADFDIYDLYYSGKSGFNTQRDSNIVLVQLGNNRLEIAEQLQLINKHSPKVIGIDAFFERNTDSDIVFKNITDNIPNLVFINRYTESGIVPNVFNNTEDRCGFGNFLGTEYSVIRTFVPALKIHNVNYDAFASCITHIADSSKYQTLKERNNNVELINFKGNIESYTNLSAEELIEYEQSNQLQSILNNKIVLLGFFTKETDLPVLSDIHYTPLNDEVAGKSYPDMYGVVIHANIISMILSCNYATLASKAISYLYAFIITFFFYYYIMTRYKRKAHPSHTIFLIVQIFGILLVLYFFLKLYDWFLYKVSLEPIMISMVLSLEFFGLYEKLAIWLNKKFKYKTVFKNKHTL